MNDSPALGDMPFMEAFLDVVIPPSDDGRLPGAGQLGLAEEVARAVRADSALGPPVRAGLDAVHAAAMDLGPAGFAGLSRAMRLEVVESQLGAHPTLMMGVSVHVYRLYYQHPAVLGALGDPPRAPFPEGYEIEPTAPDLLESLRMKARQPMNREH
jgi:hypothetical protein